MSQTFAVTSVQANQTIYKYTSPRGRLVFVDDLAKIPVQSRKKAMQIDLSHISLNTEVGSALRKQVELDYQRLVQNPKKNNRSASHQPRCDENVRTENTPLAWVKWIWQEYSYLIIIILFLAAMLIATPYLIQRMEPDRWIRVVMFVMPMIGMLGIISYAATRTTQAYQAVALNQAECEESNSDNEPAPPISGSIKNIKELRSLLKSLEQERQKAAGQIDETPSPPNE